MFDLEKAIKAWKKELAGNPSLEDSYISELESVLRDEMTDLISQGYSEEAAFKRAASKMGEVSDIGAEFSKIRSPGHRFGRNSLRPPFIPALLWSYIRISLRKIRHQKGYSFINIAGLAVGLACSILIMLWVWDELSFDRFHVNQNSLYRIITEVKTETGTTLDARTPTPLGPAIAAEIPEILDVCRYQGNEWYGISLGEKSFFDVIVGIADPSFFKMFTFPLLKGNPDTALVDRHSIVITESLAGRFFGDEDPMGKILTLPAGVTSGDSYTVTGLIRDVPENSHLHFDCMIPSINMHEYHHVDFESWNSMFFYHYAQLTPKAPASEAAKKMTDLIHKKRGKSDIAIRLQPMRDVHLKSNFAFDFDNYSQGNYSTLTIFSIAAAAILLLACINFMNLATARSANRGKEVGLRKVTGARRIDIIKQFLGESIVLSFISLSLALLLAWQVLPLFNSLAGKQLSLIRVFSGEMLLKLLGITLLTGLFAGSYPAFYLSSFQPTKVLRGWFSGGNVQSRLRKGLVVFQFALTVFLVIGTLVVDKQLRYIRSKNLGIDTHYLLNTDYYQDMKEALIANPNIISFSQSIPPGREIRSTSDIYWEGKEPGSQARFLPIPVDSNYLETFLLEMKEGRFFSEEMSTDRTDAAVVNETAAKTMGFNSPIGRRISLRMMNTQGAFEERTYNVIGVMKDFHQNSLHRPIDPIIFIDEGYMYPSLNIRIRPENVRETIKFLENTWKSFVPNRPFNYNFLDEKINGFYKQEVKIKSVLALFTILALFTACLGLSGLASFIAEKRTKEIGIRKVLGASVKELILIQTREFAIWVLIANVIAWPLAYYASAQWLQGFAYRIRLGIEPALLAAFFSLSIALLSVMYKAVRAAHTNPVDSLQYE
ncbi:MAG: ABC transporter permease [Candidatus Aminicenantes bacterium]|nr:ABC transporter permease [Candidatus Aminicenantes bacterium]